MSDDDSPILRRRGRNRCNPPVIAPSPDSITHLRFKLAVPPTPSTPSVPLSPGSSVLSGLAVPPTPSTHCVLPSSVSSNIQHGVGARWQEARRKNNDSRRQQRLDCRFLEHQAVEDNSGSSVDASSNSEDDRYLSQLPLLFLYLPDQFSCLHCSLLMRSFTAIYQICHMSLMVFGICFFHSFPIHFFF